jgi:hypothetical protein
MGNLLVIAKDARRAIWFRSESDHAGWRTTFTQPSYGLEGLIDIGAVSEIGAAVGDHEYGVDLLLQDEFGQRLEIAPRAS